ncbi:hypothetical protein BLNAU_15066 [Blattamonas nauphoetae]|uniref:Uncharacterized protein n=1 Tax=Blattamonas nauphoetae TaxID=2049346 RepID=A0ABQ9XBZ0_9EUKA|nr:hypothetical protein BLNAU_15066 [Blattamonas nauphoetae]
MQVVENLKSLALNIDMSEPYLPQYQPISTYEYAPQPFEHFQHPHLLLLLFYWTVSCAFSQIGYAFFKFHKPNYTWDFTIQVLIANTNDDRLLRPAADYVSLQDPHSPLQVPQNILNITQSAPKRRQPIRVEPFSTPPSTHSAHGAGSQPSQQTVPARAPPQPPVPVNRIADPMVETQVSAFKQLCLNDSRNQLSDPKHEPAAYDTTKQDLTAFALTAQKNHELAPVVQIIPHVSNTMLNDTVTQSGMFIQTATILQSLTDLLKTTY